MEEKYTLLEILIKLGELRDELGRISMDQLAKLALDARMPESIFKEIIGDLIENRDDHERRKELMNELPVLNEELEKLTNQIKDNEGPTTALLDGMIKFHDRFEEVTNEIDQINKRIAKRERKSENP